MIVPLAKTSCSLPDGLSVELPLTIRCRGLAGVGFVLLGQTSCAKWTDVVAHLFKPQLAPVEHYGGCTRGVDAEESPTVAPAMSTRLPALVTVPGHP